MAAWLQIAILLLCSQGLWARDEAQVPLGLPDLDRDEDRETLVNSVNTARTHKEQLDDLLVNMKKIEEQSKQASDVESKIKDPRVHEIVDKKKPTTPKIDLDKEDDKFEAANAAQHKKDMDEIEEKVKALHKKRESLESKTSALEAEVPQAVEDPNGSLKAEVERLENMVAQRNADSLTEKGVRRQMADVQKQIDAKKKDIYGSVKGGESPADLTEKMKENARQLMERRNELRLEKTRLEKRVETLKGRLADYARGRGSDSDLERESVSMSAKEMEMMANDILELEKGNEKIQSHIAELEDRLKRKYDREKEITHQNWVNRQEKERKEKELARAEAKLNAEIKQREREEREQRDREHRAVAREAQSLADRINNLHMLLGHNGGNPLGDAQAELNAKQAELTDLAEQEKLHQGVVKKALRKKPGSLMQ